MHTPLAPMSKELRALERRARRRGYRVEYLERASGVGPPDLAMTLGSMTASAPMTREGIALLLAILTI